MKRRVLHVIYSLYRGGAERLIESQASASGGDFDYTVCALAGGGDLADALRTIGASVVILGKRRRGEFGAMRALVSLMRRERPALLHLHNAPGLVWGTAASIAAGIGAPVVATMHNPWSPAGMPLAYRLLFPVGLGRAARIVCVSEDARRSFAARFPRRTGRLVTIPNGVALAPFGALPPREECRRRFRLPVGVPVVGTVGRLVPVKEHRLLVEAFASLHEAHPSAHLAILGEGEERGAIEDRAAELSLNENVSIIPATPDVATFLGGLDIFVLSSRSEGMPMTLIEALAAGVPAVATAVGGVPEVIEDGRTGMLVPPGDSGALAGAIAALLDDPVRAAALGGAGRAAVRERFGAALMTERIEELYDRLLAG
ncbi:MAG: glycosyltransferase [Candidatus Krumholzibacteriota bacterium]|nr:glycosyltransferase [Candidatus Krumholzibacteriota bacterium]